MHISIPTKDLKAALARVKLAVDPKSHNLPARDILVSADDSGITLTGTTVDLFGIIPVTGEVGEQGTALVPYKELAAVAALKAPKVVIAAGEQLILRAGSTTMTLESHDVKDWPTVPSFEGPQFKLSGAQLAEVLPATTTETTRPLLTGICIKNGDLAATDSYRLYVLRTDTDFLEDEPGGIVIPNTLAGVLTRFSDITFTLGPKPDRKNYKHRYIRAEADGETWVARLIYGEFPPYNQLIPTELEGSIRFKSKDAVEALSTLEKLVPSSTASVQITNGTSGLLFTRKDYSGKVVTTEVPGIMDSPAYSDSHKEHEGNRVCFNPRYLRELLTGVGEDVELRSQNATKPWLLREKAVGGERFRLLMPVRFE